MGDPLSASVLYRIHLQLADVDRGHYAVVDTSLARHPSETLPRLSARLLGYALWHHPDLRFGAGLCAGDEPDARHTGLDGRELCWLMVGQPAVERLQSFARRCEHLGLLSWGADAERWWRRQHQSLLTIDGLASIWLDGKTVEDLAQRLQRRCRLSVTVSESTLYLDLPGWQAETELVQRVGTRPPAP